MSGIIRVTPAELEAMSNRYGSESAQVEEQISRLDNMIQELQSMWEGESVAHSRINMQLYVHQFKICNDFYRMFQYN